jgi:hypothetical protein
MGFFSNLCSCGQSIKSPHDLPAAMAWQHQLVVLTPDGSVLRGEYDGYGRVSHDDYDDPQQIPKDSQWWHSRCYQRACFPDDGTTYVAPTYGGPSPDAPDQGWFYDRKEGAR